MFGSIPGPVAISETARLTSPFQSWKEDATKDLGDVVKPPSPLFHSMIAFGARQRSVSGCVGLGFPPDDLSGFVPKAPMKQLPVPDPGPVRVLRPSLELAYLATAAMKPQ